MDLRPLLSLPQVASARASILASDGDTFEEQLRIVAIPSPSLQEEARASYMLRRFAEIGVGAVRQDGVGNVIATLPGGRGSECAPVVVSAHLDTVFPAGTDLTPRTVGRRVFAPGITDNARGLAALLAVARALTTCRLRTAHPLWFVATVGEEGIGDLRGAKHLYGTELGRAGAEGFISLDGSGLRRIVHRAIGARRLRATIRGPGGHSWSDWGAPNPAHALGDAIALLKELPLGTRSRTTLTVARVGGGTSVNAIPEEAWLEIDLRSEEMAVLVALEEEVRRILRAAVARESDRRSRGGTTLTLRVERIGERPAGSIPPDSPLVAAALATTRAVGARPELAASSTDANVPLALGMPAITIGAGGESGGIHTLDEWYANDGGGRGLERALLTVLACAGVDGAFRAAS
jgi:acetylornithine deacetylase/succinyl-diaminopimelate desuccinylase-like protein